MDDDTTLKFDLDIPVFAKKWICGLDNEITIKAAVVTFEEEFTTLRPWEVFDPPLEKGSVHNRLNCEQCGFDDDWLSRDPKWSQVRESDSIERKFHVRMPYYYTNFVANVATTATAGVNTVPPHPGNNALSVDAHYQFNHNPDPDRPLPHNSEVFFQKNYDKEWNFVISPWVETNIVQKKDSGKTSTTAIHKGTNHPNGFSSDITRHTKPLVYGQTAVTTYIPDSKGGFVTGKTHPQTFIAYLPQDKIPIGSDKGNCPRHEFSPKDSMLSIEIPPTGSDSRSSSVFPGLEKYYCSIRENETNQELDEICNFEVVSTGSMTLNPIEEFEPRGTFLVSSLGTLDLHRMHDVGFNVYRYSDETHFNTIQTVDLKECGTTCNNNFVLEINPSDESTEEYLVWLNNEIGNTIGNYWQLTRECNDMSCSFVTNELISFNKSHLLEIPDWIRNNAGWWAGGQIDDNSFVEGLQYMIKEGIISIPDLPESSESSGQIIPDWIRNNAGWWAEGMITDKEFVNGIQFMVKNGIIVI